MVCPWCFAPIESAWRVCNKCGKALVIRCARCATEAGPDTDVCENCGTTIRYRCPTCAAVVTPAEKTCNRCGAKLKDFWKSKGV